MDLKIITPVADGEEPVTLAAARLQCKVDADDTSNDTLLDVLRVGAREYAEHYTGRAFGPRVLEGLLDAFPASDGGFDIPLSPVTAITSIKYTDTAGAEQTLDPSKYALNTYGLSRRVTLTYGNSWPSTQDVDGAVRVRFACGHATANVPKCVKSAMLLHVEIESPLNPHTPSERETLEKARDALLNVEKVYGF